MIRLGIDRNIMNVDADIRPAHSVEHCAPIHLRWIDPDGIKMQRGSTVLRPVGQHDGQRSELFIIAVRKLVTARDVVIQPRQLAQSERRMKLRHSIIHPEVDLLIEPYTIGLAGHRGWIPGESMAAQSCHAAGEVGTIGQRHSALGGRNDLYWMETEDGDVTISAVADRFPPIFCPNGVRSVLDDSETITLRHSVNSQHVARLARKVYRRQHLGETAIALGFSQLALECKGTEVVGSRIDVNEVDPRTAV